MPHTSTPPVRAALALAALFASLGPAASAHAADFELDPDHTEVAFRVRHMMLSRVRGTFRQVRGTLAWDDKDVAKSRVEVVMAVSSIDTTTAQRDDHLRSADFLDAASFPSITFTSTRVQKAGAGLKVTGNLTIKDVTRPVTLRVGEVAKPVQDPFGRVRTGVHATTRIARRDFGLTWNKTLETGGVLVGEDVDIEIDAEFVRKDAEAPAPKPAPAPATP